MRQASRVWKFAVPLFGPLREVVMLPAGAKILDVAEQAGSFYLWALCNPDGSEREARAFEWVGTGHDVPEDGEHVGTVHSRGFVWHLFEVPA